VDLHIHFPQTDVIGSPAEGLLPWLENYTFPHESRFADAAYARRGHGFPGRAAAQRRHHGAGVLHLAPGIGRCPDGREAPARAAHDRGQGAAGPAFARRRARRHRTKSLIDTEALIKRKWHGHGRLGYAITPRFAPSCTEAQLRGAGELAAKYPDVWIQSHVAENKDEMRWARELFPERAATWPCTTILA
jgi:guanine deaminase